MSDSLQIANENEMEYLYDTSSLPPNDCDGCGPITSSVEGEYILLDSYKDVLENSLWKTKYPNVLTFDEEKRLRWILTTQRYVEGDREFIQYCTNTLLSFEP
jgi:hypothetical protein